MTFLTLVAFLQTQTSAPQMTTGGWIFMIGAWTAILALVIFCFSRLLSRRK